MTTATSQGTEQGSKRLTIREHREGLGWSQSTLAKITGLSRPTIIQIEREDGQPHDITAIRSSQSSRMKVVKALDEEDRKRSEQVKKLLDEAMRDGKIITKDVTKRVKAGEMSETGAMLASAAMMHTYAAQIGELDPAAANEAQEYLDKVVSTVVRKKAEEN